MVVWAYRTLFEKIYRKLGDVLVDKVLIKTPLSGNFVTLLSFITAIGSAISFAWGTYYLSILGLVLYEISIIFDYADGALARAKGKANKFGDWLDRTTDLFKDPFVFFGIGYGLFIQTQDLLMIFLGLGCVIVYLVREGISYISGFCYKETHSEFMEEHKKEDKYRVIRFFQALFIPFLIIAVFFEILNIYLWLYLIFYTLYSVARTLYSVRYYGKMAKEVQSGELQQ